MDPIARHPHFVTAPRAFGSSKREAKGEMADFSATSPSANTLRVSDATQPRGPRDARDPPRGRSRRRAAYHVGWGRGGHRLLPAALEPEVGEAYDETVRLEPRNVLAILLGSTLLYLTACGLVYDVDAVSKDYPSCGHEGQRCCAGDSCGEHLACAPRAIAGGALDGSAPDAGSPDAGATCDCSSLDASVAAEAGAGCDCPERVCQHCGDPGEPCCGSSCGSGGLTCDASGRCTGCGELGDACCAGPVLCAAGLACSQNECKPCGGENQICCAGPQGCGPSRTCGGDGRCHTCAARGDWCKSDPTTKKICLGVGDGHQCVKCGATGQPCCPSGSQYPSCDDQPVCCPLPADGTSCPEYCGGGIDCVCKSCCYKCSNSKDWKQTHAAPTNCKQVARKACGTGNVEHAYFKGTCP